MRRIPMPRSWLSATILPLLALLFPISAAAQGPATGFPPYNSFGGPPDTINLTDLNVHWDVPILSRPGRGLSFAYHLAYDSSIWSPVNSGSSVTWQPQSNWGWTKTNSGYVSYFLATQNCDLPPPLKSYYIFNNFAYHDASGTIHSFHGSMEYDPNNCDNGTTNTL